MKDKRILFCTGEGIGNVIQTIPVIRTLSDNGYVVDFWHAFGGFSLHKRLIPYIDRYYESINVSKIKPNEYFGKVSTFWTRGYINMVNSIKNLKLVSNISPLSLKRSEVDTYMDIARDLGIPEEKFKWHGKCGYDETVKDTYDVVISDGYNRNGGAQWEIKSYPYYKEVVKILLDNGLSVCSIGSSEEYVEGTVNKTGLPLLKSIGIVNNCRLLISNDTGMYHAANALGVSNVVIFTATSQVKNYCEKFHRYSTIISRADLKCIPCQATKNWSKNCKDWKCREIPPKHITDLAMNILSASDTLKTVREILL